MAGFADETAGRIDDARRLAAVRTVYGRLRRGEREALAQCVWSVLDYAQAAQALGIPVGTARSRLPRARARLRELAAMTTRTASPPPPPPPPARSGGGCRARRC